MTGKKCPSNLVLYHFEYLMFVSETGGKAMEELHSKRENSQKLRDI